MWPSLDFPKASAGIGRMGVEIELLAPRGRNRRDLADAIAALKEGRVRRFFHPQGETSKAPGTPFFENLTLGFAVEDGRGGMLAQCVDDLTLVDDLNRESPSQPGWYRIVSDDVRLIRLAMLHTDAEEPLETVLEPMAALFGSEVQHGEGGMVRVADPYGSPILLGARLPGERERACELVTPPFESDHMGRIGELLGLARGLGFQIPAEGATHLHFDAESLCAAGTVANLIRFLSRHGDDLKGKLETNPRCRRLGAWPEGVLETAGSEEFVKLPWDKARERLARFKLTKYCDFNLVNMVNRSRTKHTFEVRILPTILEERRIVEVAILFSKVFDWARTGRDCLLPVPETWEEVVF